MSKHRTTFTNVPRREGAKREMLIDLKEHYMNNPHLSYGDLSRMSEKLVGVKFNTVEIQEAANDDPDGVWSIVRDRNNQIVLCPHCGEVLGDDYYRVDEMDEGIRFREQMKDIATRLYQNIKTSSSVGSSEINAWLNLMDRLGINTMESTGATTSVDAALDIIRREMRSGSNKESDEDES